MERWVKISALFLFTVMFVACVGASDDFVVIKENIKSSDAVIIHNIDSTSIKEKGVTVIKLMKTGGDFNDLIEYLKQSDLKRVILYSHDDIDTLAFGKLIGENAGINVDLLFERTGKEINIFSSGEKEIETEVEAPSEEAEENITDTPILNITAPLLNGTDSLITGSAVEEKGTKSNNTLLIGLIVAGIIFIFIVLRLIKKKK